jgi:hypothetical protein
MVLDNIVIDGWPDFDFAGYLELTLEFGFDASLLILADPRFGFHNALSKMDKDFILGLTQKRVRGESGGVPEFLFRESDFLAFLANAAGGDDGGDDGRVVFAMPVTHRLGFGVGNPRGKRKKTVEIGEDTEDFTLGRMRHSKSANLAPL